MPAYAGTSGGKGRPYDPRPPYRGRLVVPIRNLSIACAAYGLHGWADALQPGGAADDHHVHAVSLRGLSAFADCQNRRAIDAKHASFLSRLMRVSSGSPRHP